MPLDFLDLPYPAMENLVNDSHYHKSNKKLNETAAQLKTTQDDNASLKLAHQDCKRHADRIFSVVEKAMSPPPKKKEKEKKKSAERPRKELPRRRRRRANSSG